GRGGLEAMGGEASGVRVYGEGRGSALGDYDGDGRVDLVVGQNGAGTKLYRNVGGKAGLRVRLKGGENNPAGVGAQIRLRSGEKVGPVREVKSGSGYWSQEGAVQVMGVGAGGATGIWVRWPGGKEVSGEIAKEAKEIRVDEQGKIAGLR
ncbi:MAG: ASPIC/UnbV domain-containing protein, partial [Verrucomicrobia bacterium]|nr:ASPIC/UnbV domain-containing protein [Verrucomicrobiota bacterium]